MEVLKRGTKIEYTYAGGKKVPGKIVRYVKPEEVHGLEGWYVCSLVDEHGKYGGSCHVEQLRVVK
jgi:hypothetical protein